jgi:hypothetical protein
MSHLLVLFTVLEGAKDKIDDTAKKTKGKETRRLRETEK